MQSTIEQRFPHIATKLTEVWQNAGQARDYLDALLFKESTRVERHGFTDDSWQEITLLSEVLRLEYPPLPSSTATDVWAQVADAA